MKNNQFPLIAILLLSPMLLLAQNNGVDTENWMTNPGIIGTLGLILIVFFLAVIILLVKLNSYIDSFKAKQLKKNDLAFSEELIGMDEKEIDLILEQRKKALTYRLSGEELGSDQQVADDKGLIYK